MHRFPGLLLAGRLAAPATTAVLNAANEVGRRSLPGGSASASTRSTPSTPRQLSDAVPGGSPASLEALLALDAKGGRRNWGTGWSLTTMLITLVAFVVTLGVLIVVHEYGHYRVAVACGVGVLRFSRSGFPAASSGDAAGPDGTEFVVAPAAGRLRAHARRARGPGRAERTGAPSTQPLRPAQRHRRRRAFGQPGAGGVAVRAVVLDRGRGARGDPGAPAQGSGGRAAGCARATSGPRRIFRRRWSGPVRSMSDLRWTLTQGAGGERRYLLVPTRPAGEPQRRSRARADPCRRVDSQLMRRVILTPSRALTPNHAGQGDRCRRPRRTPSAGDRVLTVDGARCRTAPSCAS